MGWSPAFVASHPRSADAYAASSSSVAGSCSATKVRPTSRNRSPAARSMARTASPSSARRRRIAVSTKRLEDDHGDLAISLLLIVGEAGELLLLHRPQPVALVARRNVRTCLQRLGPDLDLDIGVGAHVVVPVGIRRRATLRREDHIVVTVAPVGQRVDALGPG